MLYIKTSNGRWVFTDERDIMIVMVNPVSSANPNPPTFGVVTIGLRSGTYYQISCKDPAEAEQAFNFIQGELKADAQEKGMPVRKVSVGQ